MGSRSRSAAPGTRGSRARGRAKAKGGRGGAAAEGGGLLSAGGGAGGGADGMAPRQMSLKQQQFREQVAAGAINQGIVTQRKHQFNSEQW